VTSPVTPQKAEVRRRQANSKGLERRVARALGSDRFINNGLAHSDSRADCKFSVEATQTLNPDKALRAKWKQCSTNAEREGRPAVLVIGYPGERMADADVRCLFSTFVELFNGYQMAKEAGLL